MFISTLSLRHLHCRRWSVPFALAAALWCLPRTAPAQSLSAFEVDVAAAIDDGLEYLRRQQVFDGAAADARNARGLAVLALLAQSDAGQSGGYATLSAADAGLAREALRLIVEDATCGPSRGFYAYCHGHSLMALGLYARTGGPEVVNTSAFSLRSAIDSMVDSTVGNQTTSGNDAGFWGYTGPGDDSSTTQYAAAGLAAARGYYIGAGDPGGRLGAIDAALVRTAEGYARRRIDERDARVELTDCNGQPTCAGHGYRTAGFAASYQQTGSGLWAQLLGGFALDHASVQASLAWQRGMYNYATIDAARNEWRQSYYYALWSSAKAWHLLEGSGVLPVGQQLTPADFGTLAPLGARLANRQPAVDARPLPRGPGAAGWYAATSAGWYYDFAYTLMGQQEADGRFGAAGHGC